MRTVTVRMHAADLSSQMAAMRGWLDHSLATRPLGSCMTRPTTRSSSPVEFPLTWKLRRSQGASN